MLVRATDFRSKGCKFESRQRRRGNFLLQSQLCVLSHFWCPFLPHVTTVANKRPRSFCLKWGWHITPKHTYTLYPTKSEWADYAAVQAQCGILPGNELAHMSANIWPQSSRLAEPLWTDPNTKSGISVREPIST